MNEVYDAVVIGGGPAGLACALWLGRYRRSVCIFDTGDPRNRPAGAVHGFPGIQDPPPLELRARIREQAVDAGAEFRIGAVSGVSGERDHFEITVAGHEVVNARRVIMAYGLRDFVPDVPGIELFYGHSVYHCPDCDGPSVEGQRVGVIGSDHDAATLALFLLTWTSDVTLFTNGIDVDDNQEMIAALRSHAVGIDGRRITGLAGDDGRLAEVALAAATGGDRSATTMPIDAMFFHLGSEPRCSFASDLGCTLDRSGYVDVDRGQQTSVPGLYAAGDIAGHPHLAIAAAAEGVRAALAVHRSLLPDDVFVDG